MTMEYYSSVPKESVDQIHNGMDASLYQ